VPLPTDLLLTVSTLLRPTLAVRLFGQRQLSFADQPLRFGAPVRALSLLAYLLLNRDKALARDTLAYTLWPDEPESDARANLRRHLYLLQNDVLPRTAGVQWVLADARTVRWNPSAPLWLDVAEFERLLDEDNTAAGAAELYHGDLLADVEDEWLEKPREAYRARFCELLLKIAHARRTRGDISAALGYTKVLLQHDTWREDGLRLLMELRHESGDRASALREYREFSRRLKDEVGAEPMPETTHLFERIAAATDSGTTPVAFAVPAGAAHNLPLFATTLHGRENDLAAVMALLEQVPLVTLSGAGGVGKTRLAVEVGRNLAWAFRDGAWVVEFAAISDPALVVPSIAATIGVREREGALLAETLVEALKSKQLLLLLDNCEHLVDAIAKAAYRIVQSCASVRIVATSREPLRVAGERVFRVPALSLPDVPNGRLPSLEDLKQSSAVRLFLDRASVVVPAFQAGEADTTALAAICRRLDGIPFAIELAAARLRVLSIRSLAERLDDRFGVLVSGDRTALPRHQTLRALLDWSHDLLTESERRLLRHLALFAGRFTLEAAAAVCAGDEGEKLVVLDLLSALVDKSLVIAEPRDDRYRLLETTREYASEQLRACGDYAEGAARFAAFYVNIASLVDDLYWTLPTEEWLAMVTPETENLQEALHWCFNVSHQYTLGAAIAGKLVQFWRVTPYRAQGKRYIDRALEALPPAVTPTAAHLYFARSQVAERSDKDAAKRACELYEELEDKQGLALAYSEYAVALADEHQELDHFFSDAIEIVQQLNRPRMSAAILETQVVTYFRRGNYERSNAAAERAYALYQLLGDEVKMASCLARLADCAFALTGNVDEALRLGGRAHAMYDARPNARPAWRIWCVINLAGYSVVAKRFDEARALAAEGLVLSREGGVDWQLMSCVEQLAAVQAAFGQARRAARTLGFTSNYLDVNNIERGPTERACLAVLMEHLRAALPEDEIEALLLEGASLGRDVILADIDQFDRECFAPGGRGEVVWKKQTSA
jgi:predicted ATPase/DNA-binding SARP family transcriptional activator